MFLCKLYIVYSLLHFYNCSLMWYCKYVYVIFGLSNLEEIKNLSLSIDWTIMWDYQQIIHSLIFRKFIHKESDKNGYCRAHHSVILGQYTQVNWKCFQRVIGVKLSLHNQLKSAPSYASPIQCTTRNSKMGWPTKPLCTDMYWYRGM